jgi:hypothetical protein
MQHPNVTTLKREQLLAGHLPGPDEIHIGPLRPRLGERHQNLEPQVPVMPRVGFGDEDSAAGNREESGIHYF